MSWLVQVFQIRFRFLKLDGFGADEFGIGAIDMTHFFVCAALDHFPPIQYDDLIAVANGTETMRNDETGAATPSEVVVDAFFGYRIERAGGFVQHENRRGAAPGAR